VKQPLPELPELGCVCATVRRTARLVTQVYDAELRGLVDAPQFALLSALDRKPGCPQAALGRILGLDKTTLSRNLRILERNGWIEPAPAGDLRERGFVLSADGKRLLTAARPRWTRAQERLRSAMTPQQWDALWGAFRAVTEAARTVQHEKGART
jgi:DNA-binding MarR family transcriptional regulator